jgi:phosphatidate cytidylyltransferase
MMGKADFSDLTARAASAIVLLAIGGFAIWQGGDVFKSLLIIAGALMAWETSRMHEGPAVVSGALAGVFIFLAFYSFGLSSAVLLALHILIALIISVLHGKARITVFLAVAVVIFATTALGHFRENQGLILTLWLLLCIVASDIGGYFAGKVFGGPKLWVRISPKKTWSGTLGGWALAAVVGTVFVIFCAQPVWLIFASVLVACAAQAGDLAESAMKRRAGIKDSSNLIPGHGGLLDRFDGVLGVCLLVFLAGLIGLM